MSFNEANTVEQMIIAAVAKRRDDETLVLREETPGWGGSLGGALRPAQWEHVPAADIPRCPGDVF